jgi:hypothetical protein
MAYNNTSSNDSPCISNDRDLVFKIYITVVDNGSAS